MVKPNSMPFIMLNISVHDSIFQTWPTFCRGLVIAHNIDNRHIDPELIEQLNDTCEQASAEPVDLKVDSRIMDWDNAHIAFESNPNRFPPAHKALRKRVQKPGVVLNPINAVISIMNICSIADVIPVGGDDLGAIAGAVELIPATGEEIFVPLGQPDVVEHPEPGEIVYWHPMSKQVMCRRWNWRNSHTSRILETTTSMVMNIDGIGENSQARASQTRDRVAEMLKKYCKADVKTGLISIGSIGDRPQLTIR
ncbi:MAG: hypothetical protein GKR95_13550 [Gammaproteobacteria bacterium]|nr:hypothetical protein [Gammaproteobacteria bacterium]